MARAILTHRDLRELPIPQGIGAILFGTEIPDGWELANGTASVNDPAYTRPGWLDRFAKGVAATGDNPGAMGGATQHNHSVPSHNHTHTQGSCHEAEQCSDYNSTFSRCDHVHPVSSNTDTLSTVSHLPVHLTYKPIVYTLKGQSRGLLTLRELAASCFLPRKMIFMWGHSPDGIPSGFAKCDGGTYNGVTTPNLLGKYLRGIPNTATEPGTTGGAVDHVHNCAHTHGTDGPPMGPDTGCGGTWPAAAGHGHTLNASAFDSSRTDHQPPNITVHWITFVGHGINQAAYSSGIVDADDLAANLKAPRGLVGAWAHPLAEMPTGWSHCDGGAWANGAPPGYGASKPDTRRKFLRAVPDAVTVPGGPFGQDTHTHSASGHTHSLTHSGYPTWIHCGNCGYGPAVVGHTHTTTSVSYTSIGNVSNNPPYHEVAFLVRD